jgi:seryl-tRNA synthetase
MLDPKFVRENLNAVEQAARVKNLPFEAQKFKQLYDARLQQLEKVELYRRTRNESSESVKKSSTPAEKEALLAKIRSSASELSKEEQNLKLMEEEFNSILLSVPSIPSEDTPVGKDDSENIEWKKWGKPTQFSFEPKNHIDIGVQLGIVDFTRGTNIAGSRSYILVGKGAQLERAVHNFALDFLHTRGYVPYSVPVLVKSAAMLGTGYLPGGAEQAYHVEKDDLWLVGTSEVSLASFHADETIDAKQLPIKMCAHSSCFRREAGAHGKDTRGLYRVHQFQKIEQVVLCAPNIEASDKLHAELLENAELILQSLELPYRVVKVCTGDLGQGQVKKHDVETWMPSRQNYGETHSCSSFYDYQARRLKIKTKDDQGKNKFVYTLNNTAVATPRLLIAILENFQTADGRVRIPKVLQKYMNNEEFL